MGCPGTGPPQGVLGLGAIRRHLEAQRDESRARIATFAKRRELGTGQGFGTRIGDGMFEAISRLTEIGVGTVVGARRGAHGPGALGRVDEATYGLCDACGEQIAAERLQVMPDVVLCMSVRRPGPARSPPRRR